MQTATVGRVVTEALIENVDDLWEVKKGQRSAEDVRRVHIEDALVDTGASRLSLPTSLIRQLGLYHDGTKPVRTSLGLATIHVYEGVRLTIQGRECLSEVVEVPDGTPVLIGQLPLEPLDFAIDMKTHRLIGEPRHGGEFIIEMY